MHSIRTKITILTVSAILICSVLIGTLSAFTVKTREEQNAQRLLNTICASKLDKINSYLNIIENSVDSISRFVGGARYVSAGASGSDAGNVQDHRGK